MALDNAKNFAKATVSTGYDAVAFSVVLKTGDGARFPTAPYNIVWWNSTDYADPSDDPNVEIVRVTARTGDTLTLANNGSARTAQEGTSATAKNIAGKTYRMIAGATAKLISDLNALGSPTWDELTGTAPAVSFFVNDAGYVTPATNVWQESGGALFPLHSSDRILVGGPTDDGTTMVTVLQGTQGNNALRLEYGASAMNFYYGTAFGGYPEMSSDTGYMIMRGGIIMKDDPAHGGDPAYLYFSNADESYQQSISANDTNGLFFNSAGGGFDFDGLVHINHDGIPLQAILPTFNGGYYPAGYFQNTQGGGNYEARLAYNYGLASYSFYGTDNGNTTVYLNEYDGSNYLAINATGNSQFNGSLNFVATDGSQGIFWGGVGSQAYITAANTGGTSHIDTGNVDYLHMNNRLVVQTSDDGTSALQVQAGSGYAINATGQSYFTNGDGSSSVITQLDVAHADNYSLLAQSFSSVGGSPIVIGSLATNMYGSWTAGYFADSAYTPNTVKLADGTYAINALSPTYGSLFGNSVYGSAPGEHAILGGQVSDHSSSNTWQTGVFADSTYNGAASWAYLSGWDTSGSYNSGNAMAFHGYDAAGNVVDLANNQYAINATGPSWFHDAAGTSWNVSLGLYGSVGAYIDDGSNGHSVNLADGSSAGSFYTTNGGSKTVYLASNTYALEVLGNTHLSDITMIGTTTPYSAMLTVANGGNQYSVAGTGAGTFVTSGYQAWLGDGDNQSGLGTAAGVFTDVGGGNINTVLLSSSIYAINATGLSQFVDAHNTILIADYDADGYGLSVVSDGNDTAAHFYDQTNEVNLATGSFAIDATGKSQFYAVDNGISYAQVILNNLTGAPSSQPLGIYSTVGLGIAGTFNNQDAFTNVDLATESYAIDATGAINTDQSTTAPSTTATPVFTSYYGGNTKALGNPVGWIQLHLNGTLIKVPYYT